MKISSSSYVIFSHDHEGTTGIDDELIAYLQQHKPQHIINVKFPFIYSEDGAIRIKVIDKDNSAKSTKSKIKFYKPEPISYIKDIIWGIFYGIWYMPKTNIFFGMNNLLALVGIILKKFGKVDKVIYYIIDFTPQRYGNPVLNYIYYAIDTFVLYHSDLVVSLNQDMLQGRIDRGNLDSSKINSHIAPFGNHSHNYQEKDYQHNKNMLVYFGNIMKNKGSELFVPIMENLISQGYTQFTFTIIGGGEGLKELQDIIKKKKLSQYFDIKGKIPLQKDIDKILLQSGIAIAPYYPEDKNNFSYFADPGKVKVYLGCGLPIVITDVPPIAKDIQTQKSGLIAEYESVDFAYKIIDIYNQYKEYNKNAIIVGKLFDWNSIIDQLFIYIQDY
jgi:glycosyltransferase involved in cell wall biosynthesis